jgi:hypothetical protein
MVTDRIELLPILTWSVQDGSGAKLCWTGVSTDTGLESITGSIIYKFINVCPETFWDEDLIHGRENLLCFLLIQ